MSEDGAYWAIRQAIVRGDLAPGERLVEGEIAERIGAPRGAVRAAIVRLAQDGLVVRQMHRGAHVRRLSLDEAVEVLEARTALETTAAGYAAVRRTSVQAVELRASAAAIERQRASGGLVGLAQSNAALHRRILDISRHELARQICDRLNSQMVRFQFRTILLPGRAAQSSTEHIAIVEAIADADRPAAEAAMRDHLTNVTRALILASGLDEMCL
jgi:DNA-binding GntR family transcriptional regulator